MKLTEISAYDASPGLVTEWRLSPATREAAEQASEDPRPPSYLQEAHVLAAAAEQNSGVEAPTWLATAFDLPEPFDPAVLQSALHRWMRRHETLRSGLRVSDQGLQRFTLSPEAVVFEPHEVGEFSEQADLLRYLENRFDQMTDPLSWPTFLFLTVRRHDSAQRRDAGLDSTTIYLAFDHANVDGYSMCLIPHELRELYSAECAGRSAQLPEAGSYVDFSFEERERAARIDDSHPAVASWREFLAAAGDEQPAFPGELGLSPDDSPVQRSSLEWLMDPAEADTFDTVCKESGGNFFAGVLAAAGMTAGELAGRAVFRTTIPFHTRSEKQWMSSLGWYVGLAPIEIPLGDEDGFRDLVARVSGTTRSVKVAAEVPFPRVSELLGGVPPPRWMMSYMDLRVVAGSECWDAWSANVFGKVTFGREVYVWVMRTWDGVYVTARYPDTELARTNVQRYVESMRDVCAMVAVREPSRVSAGLR